ncbi:MAG: hypothetical protein R3E97_04700 [Candidatus Eisenbacteria bacterium]
MPRWATIRSAGLELVSVTPGRLVESQSSAVFDTIESDGAVSVDAATIGNGTAFRRIRSLRQC